MQGKIGLKILLVIALLMSALFLGKYAQQTLAIERTCFCHNVNNNPHTVCTSNKGEIQGHLRHTRNGQDTRGECPKPTPPPPLEAGITIDRPTLVCGVNEVKFEGHRDPTKNTYVKFIINGRYPEVFYGNGGWWTGELALAPTDYEIRAELWGRGLCLRDENGCKDVLLDSQDGKFTIDECEPEPTPTLEPTPTPEPVPTERPTTPAGASQCNNVAPVLAPANPLVWRLGGTAIVQWQPQDGANQANIYYREVGNPENAHAVRDIPNTGYYEINELGGLDWEFGVQESNGCAGGITTWIVDGDTSNWVLFTP
jgi:hypothetical protein